jgi:hypothetical protein
LRRFGLKAKVKGKGIKENNHLCPSPKAKQRVETDEVCGTGEMVTVKQSRYRPGVAQRVPGS